MQAHLANIFFERELEEKKERPLKEWLQSHPNILQLQFLPLLYRAKGEKVLVSTTPPRSYLEFLEQKGFSTEGIELIDKPAACTLELWGPSRAALNWAQQHNCTLALPDWDRVREVHSKFFSFAASMQIPQSRLLQNSEEALAWIASFPGPKVLKRAFGLSGSGHLHLEAQLPPKAKTLFEQGETLIGEPWVQRTFDFSTQWRIGKEIEYLGATLLQSSKRGVYLGSVAGDHTLLFKNHERALLEHLEICRERLKMIQSLGFFGHLGIDAFVYEWPGGRRLRAISEINARKTFGWAALTIQRLHFPNQILHLRYEKTKETGYLPSSLGKQSFERQLLLNTQ